MRKITSPIEQEKIGFRIVMMMVRDRRATSPVFVDENGESVVACARVDTRLGPEGGQHVSGEGHWGG